MALLWGLKCLLLGMLTPFAFLHSVSEVGERGRRPLHFPTQIALPNFVVGLV